MTDATGRAERAPAPPIVGGRAPLRAILFDAGLTLIRAATPSADVAARVLDETGIAVPRATVDRAMEHAERRIEATWRDGDWFASEPGVRRLFAAAFAEGLLTLDALRRSEPRARALADRMYDEYQDTRHWEPYPDVVPTLETLAAADLQMGVVSDWGHGLTAILLELGLGAYFRFVVVSSRLGVSKPDPAVFDLALRRIGVPAAAAMYVGDTYVKDILGARAAGLYPVLLDRDAKAPALDCTVVRSLSDLPPLVGLTGPRKGVHP